VTTADLFINAEMAKTAHSALSHPTTEVGPWHRPIDSPSSLSQTIRSRSRRYRAYHEELSKYRDLRPGSPEAERVFEKLEALRDALAVYARHLAFGPPPDSE
jgi:hypothetical protein